MARTIAAIDKDITAVQRELARRCAIKNRLSPFAWQAAWDSQPELAARNKALFAERGAAQLERDERILAALRASPIRIPRPKKCPTCGGRTLAA